jgi:FtsP/CotA-like multicopper oxidase with cupredoxin domain
MPLGAFRDQYCSALRGAPESRPGAVSGGYHDACLGFGAPNTYRGLAGFMIARDSADTGDENDPDPRALRLPSGACDVPLLLADKRFDETLDHALAWDPFGMSSCFGEHVAVNGALQPYFRVARRKYRLRLWNAGPSRTYTLALGGGPPFTVIAADGTLLETPAAAATLPLGPDQRWDVVVDFSAVKLGSAVYLEDRSPPPRFRETPGLPNSPSRILKFVVERDVPDPSRVPQRLRPPAGDAAPSGIPVRTFTISDSRGVWTLNGKGFDPDRADAVVRPGSRELWIVKNESPDVPHPIRLGAEGILLPQAGGPAWESGPRIRVDLAPGREARILMRFPDWPGRYRMTDADAMREDQGLMFRWDVRP